MNSSTLAEPRSGAVRISNVPRSATAPDAGARATALQQKNRNLATHRIRSEYTNRSAQETQSVRWHHADRRAAPGQFRISDLTTWTGRVIEVDPDIFTAELIADDQLDGEPLLADFATELVVTDGEALQPGDVVYVVTRMVRTINGLPLQTSSVRLRRLGKWTAEEILGQRDRALVKAARFAELAGEGTHSG